jgi:hypothetical protein
MASSVNREWIYQNTMMRMISPATQVGSIENSTTIIAHFLAVRATQMSSPDD